MSALQRNLPDRSYSVRIAIVGSMRTARAAGIEQAINATSATAPPTVANVTGSCAGTSKSSVAMTPGRSERTKQTEQDAADCPCHSLAHDEADDISACCAHRHPHANLPGA